MFHAHLFYGLYVLRNYSGRKPIHKHKVKVRSSFGQELVEQCFGLGDIVQVK
jgi:hypothetical protein